MTEQEKRHYCLETAKEFVLSGQAEFRGLFEIADKIYAYVFERDK